MKHRLLLLAAAVLWSTAGAAIKLCGLGPWQIAAGRSLVAGLILLALVPQARRRPTPLSWLAAVVSLVASTKRTTVKA
jgi:drug/metabolite transporter, DME family